MKLCIKNEASLHLDRNSHVQRIKELFLEAAGILMEKREEVIEDSDQEISTKGGNSKCLNCPKLKQ